MTNQSYKLRKLVVAAILGAIAFLMVLILPIKVQFLTFDAKDAIIAIASLFLGPLYGLALAIIVPLIEMLTISGTGFYGFVMNFLSSGAFALTCGIIYKFKRNYAGAIIGVICSVVAMTGVMMVANLFITPIYMGVERSVVVDFIPTMLLPFNLTKSMLNAGITLLLYKPFTTAIRATKLLPVDKDGARFKLDAKTVVLFVVAIVIIAAALFVFFKMLGASL